MSGFRCVSASNPTGPGIFFPFFGLSDEHYTCFKRAFSFLFFSVISIMNILHLSNEFCCRLHVFWNGTTITLSAKLPLNNQTILFQITYIKKRTTLFQIILQVVHKCHERISRETVTIGWFSSSSLREKSQALYSMHHRTLIQSFELCIWMKHLITEYVLMGLELVEWIKMDLIKVGLMILCS